MTLNIAIVGTGNIGRIHARAVHNTPNLTLTAVVDNQPDRLAAFAAEFNVPNQYGSVEDLLKSGTLRVDAMVIGVPNYLHAPLAITALKARMPVLVEKPMATSAAEAIEMAETSYRCGAELMVGHCWRFDKEVIWLKQQAQAGRLGKMIRTKSYGVHVHWGPQGWFTQKKFAGGGALADMGIHAIDTTRFLLGEPQPVSVYPRLGAFYGKYDVDDTGVIVIGWDNGVTSYIESGWWQPHADGQEASTQLYGLNGFGQVFPTRLELPNVKMRRVDVIESGFPFPRLEASPQSMYDAQMARFAECVTNKITPMPGCKEGLANMKIIDAAYQSAQTGKVVEL